MHMIYGGLAQTFVSSTFGKAQLMLLSLLSDNCWIDLYKLDSSRNIMKQTGRVIFVISSGLYTKWAFWNLHITKTRCT